jgi:3-oxoacid CoA-transferase A subunit
VNKIYAGPAEAVADIFDGAVIMIGGFGPVGSPAKLVFALADQGARDLTIITNNVGLGDRLDVLFENRQVRKFIGSFPVRTWGTRTTFLEKQWRAGEIEVEVVPQGTVAERIRAGGAGLGGFYTPTGVGTVVEQGKERRALNGREYILEMPLRADFALIRAQRADTMGNLVYRMATRNFNPVMATAANVTIAEVQEIVPAGALDPEVIVTPGIFVKRIVQAERDEIRWFDS